MNLDYEKMLEKIDALLNNDMAFEVTSKTSDTPSWTQEEAVWMAKTIGDIYSISHCIHCRACSLEYEKNV